MCVCTSWGCTTRLWPNRKKTSPNVTNNQANNLQEVSEESAIHVPISLGRNSWHWGDQRLLIFPQKQELGTQLSIKKKKAKSTQLLSGPSKKNLPLHSPKVQPFEIMTIEATHKPQGDIDQQYPFRHPSRTLRPPPKFSHGNSMSVGASSVAF